MKMQNNNIDLYNINSLIASRISDYRDKKNLTQDKISEMLHMSRTAYNQLETGKTKLTVEKLYEISRVLDVPVRYFLPDLDEKIDEASVLEFSEEILGDVIQKLDSIKKSGNDTNELKENPLPS
jgi:transcriptional regulator with XRE-family HTH domain